MGKLLLGKLTKGRLVLVKLLLGKSTWGGWCFWQNLLGEVGIREVGKHLTHGRIQDGHNDIR